MADPRHLPIHVPSLPGGLRGGQSSRVTDSLMRYQVYRSEDRATWGERDTNPGGAMAEIIARIHKVKEEWGSLSNMSPHPVDTTGDQTLPLILRREWRTSEALFQALRFCGNDHETVDDVIELVWRHKSPMGAKMIAKSHKDQMLVVPCSNDDLYNMRRVLERKLAAHAEVRTTLSSTTGMEIIEDCSNRTGGSGLFWGAALMPWGRWVGENWLGSLWTDILHEPL